MNRPSPTINPGSCQADGVLVGSSPWTFRVSMIPNIRMIATAPM